MIWNYRWYNWFKNFILFYLVIIIQLSKSVFLAYSLNVIESKHITPNLRATEASILSYFHLIVRDDGRSKEQCVCVTNLMTSTVLYRTKSRTRTFPSAVISAAEIYGLAIYSG